MSLTNHEKYKLTYNMEWIQSLETKEIDVFSVDLLENQWMLYKDPYTEDTSNENRLQITKNRPGDVLLRRKNDPYGFKLIATESDIDSTGRQYQANINDEDLRAILDGNCYDLKLFDNYGTCFGLSDTQWISIVFEITGTITNTYDEEFINIQVLAKHNVDSLNAFVDNIIYNSSFYTITYEDLQITTYRYNISDGSTNASTYHTIDPEDVITTSTFNDLSGLTYPPVTSRMIPINGTPTDKLGRIWTTEYSDDIIYLAYECDVPTVRSDITGVTEGIVLIELDKDVFLDSSIGTFNTFVFDTLQDIAKLTRRLFCQAYIPDFDDEKVSFGNSISIEGNDLAVGSDREEAVYIFDLTNTDTPDIFSTEDPSLPTNGTKIPKNYRLEQRAIYPIHLDAGYMDFEVFGGTGIKWALPSGAYSMASGEFLTNSRPMITLTEPGIVYLMMDSFKDNVTIDAHSTTTYRGTLSDVPDISFGLDLSNTNVSGYFNAGQSLTDINIENTDLSQTDLEQSVIVLHKSGNVCGTLEAATNMPSITEAEAIGAVNSLIAKEWDIDVNMPFHPPIVDDTVTSEPMVSIEASITSGLYAQIYQPTDDFFNISGSITSGSYDAAQVDQFILYGATNTPDVNGTYNLDGTINGRDKFTKTSSPFNSVQYDGISEWDVLAVPSGSYYSAIASGNEPPQVGWLAEIFGTSPVPSGSYVYN